MNQRLKKIFDADQKDRTKSFPKNTTKEKLKEYGKWLLPRDEERLGEVKEIIKRQDLIAEDYYRAAMIFHHVGEMKKAITLAKKSMDMGYERAKWLYAATVDRELVKQGRKQKYGTQFRYKEDGTLELRPVNKRTPESEKRKHNVLPPEVRKKELEGN